MTTDHHELTTTEVEEPVLGPDTVAVDLDSPVRALDGPEYIEVDGVQVPNYDLTIPIFSEGDVVTGRVVRVDKDEVLVDIGYKSEGVIPLPELSIRKSVRPEDEVSLGEMVDALVMQKEDPDGRLILSKKRARFEKAWKRIEAAAAAGENVEGTVIEVVKGGLILDLGVRGFLPASLVDIRRVQDLDEFLGRKLECKVIELNRNRNNVVLSRRAVLEDERREVRQKILDELQPGEVVEGVISNIVEFGAFVDLDGIDGLIHISELSWSHVNHPSEILQIGEKVRVKVLDIDRDRQRISLGLKQTQADPWQSVIESYEVNDVVEGKVTKVVTFGAFVEIHPGVEGLVHISELAAHHVENPREVVNQGDVLAVRVIEIDADRRRLSLSLKRVADSDPIQHHLPEEVRSAPVVPDHDDEGPEALGASADPALADAPIAGEPPTDQVGELALSDEVAADEMVAEGGPPNELVAEEAPAEELVEAPTPELRDQEAPVDELVEAPAEELEAQQAPAEELLAQEPAAEETAPEPAPVSEVEAPTPPEGAEEPDAD
jgi:small subunit ribosomal protein S1